MKKLLCAFSLLSVLTLAAPSFARAEHSMNEIDGTTNALLTFGTGTTTFFQAALGFDHVLIQDFLQGTVLGTYLTSSPITALNLTVGPTFNYTVDSAGLSNAFYLTLSGGIGYGSAGGTSSTSFAYNNQIGKRFSIFPSVSWKPFFAMLGTTSTGANPQFQLAPLAFSFEF